MIILLSACVEANTTAVSVPTSEPSFSPAPILTKKNTTTITPTEILKTTSTSFLPSSTPSRRPELTEQLTTPLASTFEEAINEGVHSYSFETEFECTTVVSIQIEKFRITFFQASVELERLEPEPPWRHLYQKIADNTYAADVETDTGKLVHNTVEFNPNGFTLLSEQQSICGKYIRTLVP